MKPPNASTSITGFSLYEIPYYESEIDSNSTATPQRESRLPPTRVAPWPTPRPCDYPTTRPRRAPRVALRLRAGSGTFYAAGEPIKT